jgi:8-oxo-dGTP pyrophosphatase MutT (NUDIX family)
MATASDISWESPQGIFNLRVAAILTSGSDILLCTIEGLDHWYLPGGRVHLGESSEAALARELSEELGHEFPAGTLALVIENIYGYQGLEHEIGFYYRLAWPTTLSRDDLCGGEPGHVFRWVPATDLGSLRFEPAGLASVLHNLDGTLRHLVLDQVDG